MGIGEAFAVETVVAPRLPPALLAAGLLLGGCAETGARFAALHLQDIGNEPPARNAKMAFDTAKLREPLNAEPENQKKLSAVAGYLGANRDPTLHRAIGGWLPLHDGLVKGTLAEGFRQLGIRVGASETGALELQDSGVSLRLFEAAIAEPKDDLISFRPSGCTPEEITNALLAPGLTVGVN